MLLSLLFITTNILPFAAWPSTSRGRTAGSEFSSTARWASVCFSHSTTVRADWSCATAFTHPKLAARGMVGAVGTLLLFFSHAAFERDLGIYELVAVLGAITAGIAVGLIRGLSKDHHPSTIYGSQCVYGILLTLPVAGSPSLLLAPDHLGRPHDRSDPRRLPYPLRHLAGPPQSASEESAHSTGALRNPRTNLQKLRILNA